MINMQTTFRLQDVKMSLMLGNTNEWKSVIMLLVIFCYVIIAVADTQGKSLFNPTAQDTQGKRGLNDYYNNYYNGKLDFICREPEKFISRIESWYDERYKDRVYRFECSHLSNASARSCSNSAPTPLRQQYNFTCPEHRALAGWHSTYDPHLKDRATIFSCCKYMDIDTTDCKTVQNNIVYFDFTLDPGYILVGVASKYKDWDRKFYFTECRPQGYLEEYLQLNPKTSEDNKPHHVGRSTHELHH